MHWHRDFIQTPVKVIGGRVRRRVTDGIAARVGIAEIFFDGAHEQINARGNRLLHLRQCRIRQIGIDGAVTVRVQAEVDRQVFDAAVRTSTNLAAVSAAVLAAAVILFGPVAINTLTDLGEVRSVAVTFLPWATPPNRRRVSC